MDIGIWFNIIEGFWVCDYVKDIECDWYFLGLKGKKNEKRKKRGERVRV